MRSDSMLKTLSVALAVCVVCSVVVSTAAVMLKSLQEENKANDRKRNILVTAGLLESGDKPNNEEIVALFENIEQRVVDLETGEFVDDVRPGEIDEAAELKTPGEHINLTDEQDLAGIRHRANLRVVYFLRKDDKIERIILPVRGRGLWSTMYGFIALAGDGNTVEAMEFYAHGETPGLGGEIENAKWKAKWRGKKIYGSGGKPQLEVIKGQVDADSPEAVYEIDGLSGATITSLGVTKLIHFWFGDLGYGPMLERLHEEKQLTPTKNGG